MTSKRSRWYGGIAVFLCALLVRLLHLDHTPLYDEMYHVLAAQSWLRDGTLSIGDGLYERGRYFTLLVAGFFRLFGETLTVARLPSAIAGSLMVGVTYSWLSANAGRVPALICAVLLIFSPISIFLSQFARFYALHALSVVLASFAIYYLVAGRRTNAGCLIAACSAPVLIWFAYQLQITTLIALMGLVLWVALFYAPTAISWLQRQGSGKTYTILVLSGITVILLLLGGGERLAGLWGRLLNESPHWAGEAGGAQNLRFYYYWLLSEYPTLWSLFPVAVIIALVKYPRPALFSTCVFITAFILHSIAGFKAYRYFGYAIPYLGIIFSLALAAIYPALRKLIIDFVSYLPFTGLPAQLQKFQYRAILSVVVLFMVLVNPAFPLAVRMMIRSDASWSDSSIYRGSADWAAAAKILQPVIAQSDVVLTPSGIMALYFLGGYDLEINENTVAETASKKEFAIDPRTGKPAIGTPASLKRVIACYPSGLIVAEKRRWQRAPHIVPQATAQVVSGYAEQIPLPKKLRIIAFKWHHPQSKYPQLCS